MDRSDVVTLVRDLRAGLRDGTTLSEPQAQEITRALSIGVPAMVVATGPDDASRADLPGERVVVKVVGPAHKSDIGGVRVVPNTPAAIADTVREMRRSGGATADGFLVAEFVDHGPGTEILAGVRWTDAFGPVVTIGPGGTGVESGPAPAIVSRATADLVEAALAGAAGTRRLTGSTRGAAPVASVAELSALAIGLLEFGEAVMPHDLSEFEINPLVFTEAGPVALDALAVSGAATTATADARPVGGIAAQLRPRSIAVMGVSEGMNPGRVILRNVLAAGFPRERVVVVKPGSDGIDGCRCVPALAALAEPVDLLVVAVSAASVPDVMEEAVASGSARSVILISGGLGEVPGTEEAARRVLDAIGAARREGRAAPVVTGPNSMGIRSTPGTYDATFIPAERMTPAPKRRAPVAVVSQSGAFTLSRLDRLPWLEPRYVVSAGNQLDLTIGDYLGHFADDPDVAVAACYLEGFSPGDGDRALRAAVRMGERGGVLVWYRGGRTAAGARSAASHTAAVATDDAVAATLAGVAGILEAATLHDFDDLLRLAVTLHEKPIAGRRLAVVSNAGFECVAAADALCDLDLAPLSIETAARLDEILADAGLSTLTGVRNPLDLTPVAADEPYAAAVEAVLDDPSVDLAVIGCVPFTPALRALPADMTVPGSLPARLATLADHPTPWVAVVDAGRLYDPMADHLAAAGVPVIRSMDRAVRLLGRYVARIRAACGNSA